MKRFLALIVTFSSLVFAKDTDLDTTQTTPHHDDKCRILSFSAGGVHLVWETGVFKAIVEQMARSDILYDYVGGVSAGALCASFVAIHPIGEEMAAFKMLEELIVNNPTSDLFEKRGNYLTSGFLHDSYLDNTNYHQMISEALSDKEFVRGLSFMSCDINSG